VSAPEDDNEASSVSQALPDIKPATYKAVFAQGLGTGKSCFVISFRNNGWADATNVIAHIAYSSQSSSQKFIVDYGGWIEHRPIMNIFRGHTNNLIIAVTESGKNFAVNDIGPATNYTRFELVEVSKNDSEAAAEAFEDEFVAHKKDRLFKGLPELHKAWKDLSETGSHSNINSTVDRFAQITDAAGVEMRLNFTGVENTPMWAMMIFTMLLAFSTMEDVYFRDYEERLKFDDTLRAMRAECDRFKEHVRQTLIDRYNIQPPGGIHPAPKAVIFRL
jgi:hypothetical protein